MPPPVLARAGPTVLQQHRHGRPSADLGAAAQRFAGCRAARPGRRAPDPPLPGSSSVVSSRTSSGARCCRSATAARSASPSGPPRRADCAAHGHAQPASGRGRAAAEDGDRGWEAARRQPAPQSTGVGGVRAPHSLPAGFFLFFFSLAGPRLLSFRPRDIDELTRGTTASQRPASTSAAARGRCVGERRPGATRVVCRRPPGQRPRGAGGEKPAGRSLPPPPLVPRRRLGLLLRAPERAPTQAHPTSGRRANGGGGARDRPSLLAPRHRQSVDWRPARRPSSPARAHSHVPAARA